MITQRLRSAERTEKFQFPSNPLFSPNGTSDAKAPPTDRKKLFRYDDSYLLLGSTAAAVLANNHDSVLARIEGFREVPEAAI